MEQSERGPTIAEFRAELHTWLDAHADELAPTYDATGHARRADRADAAGEGDPVRRRLDALRLARARRRPRRLADAAHRARRLAGEPRPRRPRPVLAHRGARADAHRLRAAGARGRRRPAAALRRRAVVPGLLGARAPAATSPRCGCRGRPRRRSPPTASAWVDQRPEGVDQPGAVRRPVRAPRRAPGPPESRHRGITAFFVDMDTPGITVAPIEMLNGVQEFAEVFFDDVVVPADRMLGEVDGGWAVAMSILPYERSSCFWQRIAYLYRRLEQAGRGRARRRPHRRGRRQRVPRAARAPGAVAGDPAPARRRRDARRGDLDRQGARRHRRADDLRHGPARCSPASSRPTTARPVAMWRTEYLYSRAATIYGGTAEVQRNIIARRLLDLGPDE